MIDWYRFSDKVKAEILNGMLKRNNGIFNLSYEDECEAVRQLISAVFKSFDVSSTGKINCIRATRELTSLGLFEATKMVERNISRRIDIFKLRDKINETHMQSCTPTQIHYMINRCTVDQSVDIDGLKIDVLKHITDSSQ